MLNAKTIGFLLIIMSNHDLYPYHEEIGRYKVCRYKRQITPDEGKTKSPESPKAELPLTRNDANRYKIENSLILFHVFRDF